MKSKNHKEFVSRRAELMAELFLGEFEPKFIANTTDIANLDYFVGFENSSGSLNVVAVEVKPVESPIESYSVKSNEYKRLTKANLPVLLLVIDVKHNQYYYALFPSSLRHDNVSNGDVKVTMLPIDDQAKKKLHKQLLGDSLVAA